MVSLSEGVVSVTTDPTLKLAFPNLLSAVARALSPRRPGQDARSNRRNSGAQASSLCGTGRMPVLPL